MQFKEQIQQQHLDGLNEEQKDAVLCRADIVYVSAGPGTGKTHMLASKLVDYILSSDTPQRIVALSYTNTAARQIGERFKRKLQDNGTRCQFNFFNGTIHSFAYRMLRAYHSDSSSPFEYTILDEEELSELAEEIYLSNGKEYPKSDILTTLKVGTSCKFPLLAAQISKIKEGYRIMSIQDILVKFIEAIDKDLSFRSWIGCQVTAIAFDEAQDLTEQHYVILDRLLNANPQLKVFLVGDPRQNIFEFNGGSYKHLNQFLLCHSSHEEKSLTITYRCGQAIADYVNTFNFADCENRHLQSRSNENGEITVVQANNEAAEAVMVLDAICGRGDISKCAVLSNSLKYLNPLIGLLIKRGIPYKVFGGRKLLRRHIRFLNHVLRIIDSGNAYSIRKVAQYAGIDIVRDGKKRKSAFFESPLGQIILRIHNESQDFNDMAIRVVQEIMWDEKDTEQIRADYEAFLSIAAQFSSPADYLAAFATDKELFSMLYDADYVECPIPVGNEFLTISTVHSAKGLEWDNVFVMGLCEGNFPNPYFCQGCTPDEQREFFNNEWKKMYVASTRARNALFLSYPATIERKGYTFPKQPSRFIRGISNPVN